MPKFINGPYNYIQLSGNINNIDKNITIFMDIHQDINNQTRCDSFDSFDSLDISHYLYQLIKKTTTPLDFFLEIRNEQIQEPITDKKDVFIAEVIEMFKTEFIKRKDKVTHSKSNPNVRLHYLDIRDHLQFSYVKQILNKQIIPKLTSLKNDILKDSDKNIKLEEIKKCINDIKQYTMDIFEKNIDIYHDKSTIYDKKSKEFYLNKIIHKYKHNTLKTNINNFFNTFFMNYNGDFNKIIFEINTHIIFFKNDINNPLHLTKIFLLCNKLNKIIYALYALITDVYFLRRFLDKDYIQNVITYCGRNHALNYIYFLVKHCDFTIIKIYNSNGLSLDNFINKIKKTDDLNKVHNLFLIEGEKPKQCVVILRDNILLGW